jgi:hypothetical protein
MVIVHTKVARVQDLQIMQQVQEILLFKEGEDTLPPGHRLLPSPPYVCRLPPPDPRSRADRV